MHRAAVAVLADARPSACVTHNRLLAAIQSQHSQTRSVTHSLEPLERITCIRPIQTATISKASLQHLESTAAPQIAALYSQHRMTVAEFKVDNVWRCRM